MAMRAHSLSPRQAGSGLFGMSTGSGRACKFGGNIDVGKPFAPLSVPVEKVGNTPFEH